jgi:hypothetical protein
MTAFHVGQRVRIKWSVTWPFLAGKEGLITGVSDPRDWTPGFRCDWLVTPDGFDSPRLPNPAAPSGFSNFGPLSEQLEPLTDSNELVSWESMRDLWVPEHLREAA